MSKQTKIPSARQPVAGDAMASHSGELTDDQLDNVTGGATTTEVILKPIIIIKPANVASPKLF
jgi:hypothetical protein